MPGGTDDDIIRRFRAGDREGAFKELVEIHGKTVYNIALFTMKDEVLAEDATQDAFIRIYRGLSKFRGQSKLSTWMYRIVKNVCLDTLKKRHPVRLEDDALENLPDGEAAGPEERAAAAWRQMEMRAAMARLRPRQRLALTLYYFQDQSYEEVAAIMGEPLGTIKSHLHRGKAALAPLLASLQRRVA